MDEKGYSYCEQCGRSDRRTQVHYLVYASRAPKHPNLHDFRNLLLVCGQCHDKFHGGQYKKEFAKIEEERGLKELFV